MNDQETRFINEANEQTQNIDSNSNLKVAPDKETSFISKHPAAALGGGVVALGLITTGVIYASSDSKPSTSNMEENRHRRSEDKTAEGNEKADENAETAKEAAHGLAGLSHDQNNAGEATDNNQTGENTVADPTAPADDATSQVADNAEADPTTLASPADDIMIQDGHVVIANFQSVPIATVDADNFNDAFAQAREQLGEGGAFEFNGMLYATYTQSEWEALSPAARNDFQARAMDSYHTEMDDQTGMPEIKPIVIAQIDDIPFIEVDADTFVDAFAQARAEAGPGGAFMYEGKLYATYTEEEWKALPENERIAFQTNAMDTYEKWQLAQLEGIPEETVEAPDPKDVIVVDTTDIRFAHVDADSFSEAFAQARAEVGPGGAFEYEGKIYGTYYADEWSEMSQTQRNAFQANVARSLDAQDQVKTTEEWADNRTIHPVSPADTVITEDVVLPPAEPEIEVLGVESVMTDEGVMNFAGLTVDNEPLLLVDVDNDGVFDIGIHDDNYDGIIDETEFHDIADANITVQDVNDAANPYYSSNDMPDYYNPDDDLIMPA